MCQIAILFHLQDNGRPGTVSLEGVADLPWKLSTHLGSHRTGVPEQVLHTVVSD